MNTTKKWLAGLAFVALAPLASAAPNLIVNGSFEANSINFTGGFSTLAAGSNALTGWNITAGSVDLINTYWNPSQGHYSLDLSGETDGMQAFMGGKLRVEGDMMLSMKLSELFPA